MYGYTWFMNDIPNAFQLCKNGQFYPLNHRGTIVLAGLVAPILAPLISFANPIPDMETSDNYITQEEIEPQTSAELGTIAQVDLEGTDDRPEIRVTVTDRLLQQPIYTPFRRQGTVQEATRPTYVITQEQMEAQGWQTVDEALRYLPGVVSEGTTGGQLGAQSGQFIRGGANNQVLVLLDGRPINDLGGFGGFDLSEFTSDLIEQIEIMPGGGSTLYGSDAIGGIINIITRQPQAEGIELRPSIQVGSFGLNQQGLQFSGRRGDVAWILGYSRLDSENNFDYDLNDSQLDFSDPTDNTTPFSVQGRRDNADVLYNNFNIKVITDFSDRHQLTWSALYLDKNMGIPGGTPIPVANSSGAFNRLSPNFRQNTQEWLMDFSLNSQLDNQGNSIFTGRFYLDTLNYSTSNPDGFTTISDDVSRLNLGFQGQHSWQINDRQNLIYGADYRHGSGTNSTVLAGGTSLDNYIGSLDQGALFARYQVDITPAVRTHIGLRQDFNSLAASSFTSPSVGASWAVTPWTTLRANYARSFRAPLISDLQGLAAFDVAPNPNLDPERGHSFDIGFDQQLGDRGLLRFSYFLNDVDNLIAYQFGSPSQFVNLGRVKTTGIETSVNMQLVNNFFFLANYTWNHPEIKDSIDQGNELSFRGADVLNVGLSYENPQGLFMGAFIHNVGDRFSNNTNTEQLQGYTSLDLKLRVPINDRWSVNGSLNNLLDKSFQEYPGFPGLGRNFQLGIRGQL